MAAVTAFREQYTNSNPLTVSLDDFNSRNARLSRYQINWAMFENSAYRKVNSWAKSYMATYGLYRYIRGIYNPAYRLGDWWQSHLWGGKLDPLAGDGKTTPSAIPIFTENESLRPAIAQIWQWSNWQIKKGMVTLHGPVLGDSVVKIIDDTKRKRVYMLPVHPGTVSYAEFDVRSNVRGYVIEEQRRDPKTGNMAVYKEVCTRKENDPNIHYQTYKDDSLFAWDGDGIAEWDENYGFVPMVIIKHRDVGLDWGWSEMHPAMSNFREVDDQASLLNDQIRKSVNASWLFSGVPKPSVDPKPSKTADTTAVQNGDPEGDRQNTPIVYAPPGSTATPMVAPLQIADVLAGIEKMIAKIERDYPELSEDIDNASGDVSGRALRINREPVITKVNERRPNYDNALVRAQQMAIALAGYRRYDEFKGFDLESFDKGDLDHSIDADRPVYSKDPLDDLEIQQSFWTAAGAAKTAGIPLLVFLKNNGWSDDKIAELQKDPDYQTAQEQKMLALQASRALAANPAGTPPAKKTSGSNTNPPNNTK
jgi:hypothetical protein